MELPVGLALLRGRTQVMCVMRRRLLSLSIWQHRGHRTAARTITVFPLTQTFDVARFGLLASGPLGCHRHQHAALGHLAQGRIFSHVFAPDPLAATG